MDAAQYNAAAVQFGIQERTRHCKIVHCSQLYGTSALACPVCNVQVGFNASATAEVAALYGSIASRDGYFNGSSRLWGDGLISCNAAWAAQGAAMHSKLPTHRLLWNTTLVRCSIVVLDRV